MNLLDASAIFNLFQSGKYHLLFAGATIPLAKYEIGNILWKNHRIKDRISKEEAKESGAVLFELLDSMEMIVPSPNSTLKLSLEEGLTFYDSSYLVSAIETGYDLITDDTKLHRIATQKVQTRKSSDLK
ncbi:MAG: type II toxin-antitoxin system VapC family toxin [Candidatus Thermoplasmatota archaeon]|nr:type II toxin-antitoxin system VapC family toxin [Candidatus Thermoplasmatota archaeon]MCL5987869.1 type II toxin-antitoxin system VapC family toxin [Candidatus Thermoplasmatota archaeon]